MPKFFADVRCIGYQQGNQWFKDGALMAFQIADFIHRNHKGTHGRIKAVALGIILNFFNRLVQYLQFGSIGGIVGYDQSFDVVVKQAPQLFNKPVYAFNAEGLWLPGADGGRRTGDSKKLSRWQDLLTKMRAEGLDLDAPKED